MSEDAATPAVAPEATPETAPTDGGAPPESNSNGGSPPSDQAPGLLANARGEGDAAAPTFEDPAPTATPGEITARPDNIAEQFWDSEKGELKGGELANSYNSLRKEFNRLSQDKGKGAPEKFEDYLEDYKPPHRGRARGDEKEGAVLDRFGELDPQDPVFVAMAKFAKQGNMSPAAFTDGMQDLMEELHVLLPEPINPEKELATLGEGAEHMVKTNSDWVGTLARNGIVNEDEYNLLLNFGSTALGVQLVNKLRLNSGEKPIPGKLNGNANKGRKTPDECAAMMQDERYHADGPAGDAFRNEVDKAFAETFGTEKA